jgi:Signal transduction histidine kinase
MSRGTGPRRIVGRSSPGRRFAIGAALAAAAIIVAATVATAAYAGAQLRAAAWAAATDHARINAAAIERKMAVTISTARALAAGFEAMRSTSRPERSSYDGFIRRLLETNPSILSVWALFEPNALDGKDREYRNTAGTDSSGRYMTDYVRLQGSIVLRPIYDYDEPGSADLYYRAPIRTGVEVVTDPFFYSYNGTPWDEVFVASVAVPVFGSPADRGLPGTAIGVAGVDLGADFLRGLVSSEGSWEGEESALVSSSGKWIVHPKDSFIGKEMEGSSESVLERVHRGEDWTGSVASPIDGAPSFVHLAPIRFESSEGSWTYIISIPLSSIARRLATLVWISLSSGLAAALAAGLLLSRIAGSERALRESEAMREANERLAEAGRREVFDRVAAAVAHEMNTPLATASSSSRMVVALLKSFESRLPKLLALLGADGFERLMELSRQMESQSGPPAGIAGLEAREALAARLSRAGARSPASIADDLLDAGIQELDEELERFFAGSFGEEAASLLCASACLTREAALAQTSCARASRYVRAMNDFLPDLGQEPFEVLDLESTIRASMAMLDDVAGEGPVGARVSIELRCEGGLRLLGRHGELARLWSILLRNAIQAIGGRGGVAIEAARSGDAILVSVIDGGPGVPDSVRDRIFEPFVTTKDRGEGIGLGLSIARRIAREHGGDVGFESENGRTVFSVRLPAAPDEGPDTR